MTVLPTQNPTYGFWGTVALHHPAEISRIWEEAFTQLSALEGSKATPEGVQYFLDSRHGRHFADTVLDGCTEGKTAEAVAAAIKDWQRPATRRFVRELDAPTDFVGTPALDLLLLWAEIQAEFSEMDD